jgi:hypothetical protein
MTYPQQPGGWSDPAGGGSYIDPVTGQPAYPTSPTAYPSDQGYQQGSYQQGYQQAGYQQPGYQQPYGAQPGYAAAGGYPGYAPMVAAPATNGMAIASLVLSLCGLITCGLTSLVGAILGHVSRRQIRERGEAGDGLALGGIVAGWIIFGLSFVGGALYLIFVVWLVHNAKTTYPTDYPTY